MRANKTSKAIPKDKCELCGSVRGLEIHHIVPVSVGGTDDKENLLCVCKKCHALLTPTGLLIKRAQRVRDIQLRFYEHMERLCNAGIPPDFCDVCDYLDANVFPLVAGGDDNA